MRVRVLSPATEEITAAALWFDSQSPGLGGQFWQSVDKLLGQIEENPFRFGKSEFATPEIDFRFAMVPRFKYVVHFAIDSEEVLIIAIGHAARKPGYWLRRAKE